MIAPSILRVRIVFLFIRTLLIISFCFVTIGVNASAPQVTQTLENQSLSAVLNGKTNEPIEGYPASLIEIAPRYRYALVAELEAGALHLYERGEDGLPHRIKTMEMSIGKSGFGKQLEGDNKTPVGVYRVISHLTEKQLDDFYGNAAYPVNYPNAWDRLKNRTGYGIWLHAEPVGYKEKTRPFLDSDGCVVISNNAIDKLASYLDIGYTYLVMTPRLDSVPAEELVTIREQIHQQMAAWKTAWESREPEPYLSFYSDDFNNLKMNKAEWVTYKERVNRSKRYIKVDYSDLGIYAYPGEPGMYWVEYYQTYRSHNYNSNGWKRQLWRNTDDRWEIIYEGGG